MGRRASDFDPTLLGKYADKLYRRANWVILTTLFMGLFIGTVFGAPMLLLGGQEKSKHRTPYGVAIETKYKAQTPAAIVVAVCGMIGLIIGVHRAFWYKLEAERTLCQAAIEENTLRMSQLLEGWLDQG